MKVYWKLRHLVSRGQVSVMNYSLRSTVCLALEMAVCVTFEGALRWLLPSQRYALTQIPSTVVYAYCELPPVSWPCCCWSRLPGVADLSHLELSLRSSLFASGLHAFLSFVVDNFPIMSWYYSVSCGTSDAASGILALLCSFLNLSVPSVPSCRFPFSYFLWSQKHPGYCQPLDKNKKVQKNIFFERFTAFF